MTDPRRHLLDDLFARAVDAAPAERGALLDELGRWDLDLRRELERLLAADDGAEEQVAGIVDRALADVGAAGRFLPAGGRIGAYRVVGELGRGGMGIVYRGRRDDGAFEKDVAIKIVRRNLRSADALRRFHDERRILAGLDHPNIAQLLDAGTTGEGEPYAVLELVDGVPIDAFCAARELDVQARVGLFAKVCHAVAHAHGRLVVHRDLKPANIVVTAAGEPKLLDFGIAKLLATTGDDGPAVETGGGTAIATGDGCTIATGSRTAVETGARSETETGAGPMTPAYASPEQLRGESPGTASDVYSLGVVLYELLTGRRPLESGTDPGADGRTDPDADARAGSSADPRRPSQAVEDGALRGTDPRRLRRELAGDLDDILLTALRAEPSRRYPSVAAFEADLRRYLAGEVVTARPATLGYRLGKFTRRHRAAVSMTALALAGIVVMAGYYAVRLREERDLAAAERDKARRVAQLLAGIFERASPDASGATVTAREIVDEAASNLPRQLGRQPLLLAEMQGVIGRVYEQLGLYERARATLREALATRERVLGPDHLDVADSLCALGSVELELAGTAAAVPLAERCLAIRERLLEPDDPKLAEALFALGSLHAQARALTRERELLERARDIQLAAVPRDGRALGATLNALGAVYSREVSAEAAYETWTAAAAAYADALGPDHPAGFEARYNTCFALRTLRRHEDALACAAQLVRVAERALPPAHQTLARMYMLHSHALAALDRVAEARERREQAMGVFERAFGPKDWRVAAARRTVADTLVLEGRYDEARLALDSAAAIFREAGREASPHFVDVLVSRARLEFAAACEGGMGAPERSPASGAGAAGPSFDAFRKAAAAALAAHGALARTTAFERRDARVLAAQDAAAAGDAARVAAEVQAALAEAEAWERPDDGTGESRLMLAWALARVGEGARARELADAARGDFDQDTGPDHTRARRAAAAYEAAARGPDGVAGR
jgi:serine/threonine-protein kinase